MGVEWIVPERIRAGERLDVRVIVTDEEGTKADRISLRFVGEAQIVTNNGTVTKVLFDRTETFVERQTILGERVEYTASFVLPPNACATESDPAWEKFAIRWKLLFHIDVPWRIDVREERVVHVVPAIDVARPEAEDWHGAFEFKQGGLRAEMIVDDHFLSPGEETNGAIALFNTAGRAIYDLDVSVALLAKYRWGEVVRFVTRRKELAFATKSGFHEGCRFPFKLEIPEDAIPGSAAESGEFDYYWCVFVHVEYESHSETADLPLDVRAFVPREAPAPPARDLLGPPRWRRLFRAVASDHGFTSCDDDDIAATTTIDGTDVRVSLSGPLVMRGEIAKVLAERSDLEPGSTFDRLMIEGGRTVVEKDAHQGHSTAQLRTFIDAVKLVAGS